MGRSSRQHSQPRGQANDGEVEPEVDGGEAHRLPLQVLAQSHDEGRQRLSRRDGDMCQAQTRGRYATGDAQHV